MVFTAYIEDGAIMTKKAIIAAAALAGLLAGSELPAEAGGRLSATAGEVQKGAGAPSSKLPGFVVEMVDHLLDMLFSDPAQKEGLGQALNETLREELLGMENIPNEDGQRSPVARFLDAFIEETLEDPETRALLLQELREVVRVQVLRQLVADPEIKKLQLNPPDCSTRQSQADAI
jgi:hypothetical protein